MGKTAVIYTSKYGSTRQYAEWLAQELDAVLLEAKEVKPSQLASYDTIVYGGGIYAGGISGASLVTKNPHKRLVVFTVGLFDPETTDYSEVLEKNFTREMLSKTKVFHLRGGYDHKKLGIIHKGMMSVARGQTLKIADEKLTDEDRAFLETYGTQVDYTDRSTIASIVDYVKSLGE